MCVLKKSFQEYRNFIQIYWKSKTEWQFYISYFYVNVIWVLQVKWKQNTFESLWKYFRFCGQMKFSWSICCIFYGNWIAVSFLRCFNSFYLMQKVVWGYKKRFLWLFWIKPISSVLLIFFSAIFFLNNPSRLGKNKLS